MREKIPYCEMYSLTIDESARYFRIGENKLRQIIKENMKADFVLWNGNRMQIKRKKFEKFLDNQLAI